MWNEEIERDFVKLKRAFIEGLTGVRRISQEYFHRFKTEEKDSWDAGEESVTSMREIILVTKVNC